MGIFFLANIKRISLMEHSDLEQRETELRREIEKLETASEGKGE
jgi:hypothetical protein